MNSSTIKNINILTVVGARPQFVKAAVVSRAFDKHNLETCEIMFSESLLHTGQHFDKSMSQSFFDTLNLRQPEINLDIRGGNHGSMTGKMLAGIETEILERKPDFVLVYGDTNSTLAGALAAIKLHVKVIHVEAGLRSGNLRMPEEVNRILTDRISDILFCPTQSAVETLEFERVPGKVSFVGDVMYDAVKFYAEQIVTREKSSDFVLATIHRAENTDNPKRLNELFGGMGRLGKEVVFPIHPRTRNAMNRFDIKAPNNVRLIDPAPYFELLGLIMDCEFVITDSGGLQKEAFFLGKRCLIARAETEWPELLLMNAAMLVPSGQFLKHEAWAGTPHDLKAEWKGNSEPPSFGDGDAGEKIVETIVSCVNNSAK